MTPCANIHCRDDDPANRMGHEVRGVYDGVLFWECLVCGFVWARAWNIPARDAQARDAVEQFKMERTRR